MEPGGEFNEICVGEQAERGDGGVNIESGCEADGDEQADKTGAKQ